MSALELESITLEKNENWNRLEGVVEGKTLYFEAPPTFSLNYSANPFLAAMLIPAMQSSRDIRIPDEFPISAELLTGIEKLQDILTFWYPELSRISISATASVDKQKATEGASAVGSLFSGGLDACYSLVKHQEELTHLIYVRGIDLQLDNHIVFEECSKNNAEIAEHMGKTLVNIESNIRFFIRDLQPEPLTWYINQSGGLASVALALGIHRVYISSSNPYDAMHPLGSHPLTDPLWSTEYTKIIHTGCEKRRHEKLAELAKYDYLLQRIRVCWHDSGFNCGVCDKCIHFRMALAIMGLKVKSLPVLENYSNLYEAHVNTDGEFFEWRDNLLLARKFDDVAAEKAVNKLLNRFKLKKAVWLFDEALLGGKIRLLKNKLRA